MAADQAIKELAPTGKLRVGIAVGPAASALWCVRDPGTGKARGVPVDDDRKKAVDFGAPYHLLHAFQLEIWDQDGKGIQGMDFDLPERFYEILFTCYYLFCFGEL